MDKINFFLNSNVFKILKHTKYGHMIIHKYLSKILGHENIAFINTDGSIKYDHIEFFKKISDDDKKEIMKIIEGSNHQTHVNNKYIVKKTGSGVVMGNNYTEIVYSNTFVPFDSSF